MREVKYRAKRVDNGKWAYGGVIVCDDYCIIDQGHEVFIEEEYEHNGDTHYFGVAGVMCDEKTIGQYTGLTDLNGVEVYEGDILMCIGQREDNKGRKYYRKVVYDNGSFCMTVPEYRMLSPLRDHIVDGKLGWEVVGNIHDNSKLDDDSLASQD